MTRSCAFHAKRNGCFSSKAALFKSAPPCARVAVLPLDECQDRLGANTVVFHRLRRLLRLKGLPPVRDVRGPRNDHREVRPLRPGSARVGPVADEPNRQELLSALTTEHFTLQGARSQTVSESTGRATLYVMSVSSTLIALGFLAQISEVGDAFEVFALTVLPTLYVLGLFTYFRLVESAAEDFLYGRAVNRIRHYYLELAGEERRLFLLSGYDDARGVLANMGLRPSRWQIFFTTASMVTVINSVVGGSAVAIAVGAITARRWELAPRSASS